MRLLYDACVKFNVYVYSQVSGSCRDLFSLIHRCKKPSEERAHHSSGALLQGLLLHRGRSFIELLLCSFGTQIMGVVWALVFRLCAAGSGDLPALVEASLTLWR